jgi:hypothetical protein
MPFTREARDRDKGMYSTLFVWITIFWSIQKENTHRKRNISMIRMRDQRVKNIYKKKINKSQKSSQKQGP